MTHTTGKPQYTTTKTGETILDAKILPISELTSIVSKISTLKSKIILKNPHVLTIEDLKVIADQSKDSVLFDFLDITQKSKKS